MKKAFLFFFIFSLFYSLLDQWLVLQTHAEISNPEGAGPMAFFFAFLTLILGILHPLISSLLIFPILVKSDVPLSFLKSFPQGLIEVLRAWGKSILWSFLFIFPGLIKYCRYSFVIFIVCFDPAYQRGEVDALKQSQELSKGHLGKLLAILFVFGAAFPLGLSFFDDASLLWKTPVSALLLCFVEMLINFCFIWILWRIYESTVPMERH